MLLLFLLNFVGRAGRRSGGGFLEQFGAFIVQGGAYEDVDRQALSGVAFIDAAHGRDVAVIASPGNVDVLFFDERSDRGIEADPAQFRNEGLHPGMGSLTADDALGWASALRDEITGNVARRHPALTQHGEQECEKSWQTPDRVARQSCTDEWTCVAPGL